MARPQKTVRMERINLVVELLAQGLFTYQIVDKCKKDWSVSRRTVERYLTHVYSFLNLSLKEKDKDKILIEYDALIQKNEKMGDKKYAALYRERRDKILGLYNHEVKADITSGGKPIDEILFTLINKKEDLDNGSEH